MRKLLLVPICLAASGLATTASADTYFNLTFTPTIFGSDTLSLLLDTTSVGSGSYLVGSVTGNVDGIAVNSPTTSFFGADNFIAPGNPGQYVSANGLSFTDANKTSWHLFRQGHYTLENSVGNETVGVISITPAATPEPSTLLVSVAGLGVFALRRRRNRA